jgi:hypothetical protein
MKRLLSSIFITSCLWVIANSEYPQPRTTPQLSTQGNLMFTGLWDVQDFSTRKPG